jgi:hypothetical protein
MVTVRVTVTVTVIGRVRVTGRVSYFNALTEP